MLKVYINIRSNEIYGELRFVDRLGNGWNLRYSQRGVIIFWDVVIFDAGRAALINFADLGVTQTEATMPSYLLKML